MFDEIEKRSINKDEENRGIYEMSYIDKIYTKNRGRIYDPGVLDFSARYNLKNLLNSLKFVLSH